MPEPSSKTVMPSQDASAAALTLGASSEPQGLGKPRSLWSDAWHDLRRNPPFVISALLILFLILVAVFPSLFTGTDPKRCDLVMGNEGRSPGHPFGFDRQGCDVYARVIYGARASVAVGILVTSGVVLIGGVIGAIAGFYGGAVDSLLSRLTDMFFANPTGHMVTVKSAPWHHESLLLLGDADRQGS